jgi:hypothetical protein
MDPQSLASGAASVPRHGDIGQELVPILGAQGESPQRCCTAMAQHRAIAAGENRGHPAPLRTQPRVTDRVNPTVDSVQAVRAHPAADHRLTKARAKQLLGRDYPVLVARDGGHSCLDVAPGEFRAHTTNKSPGTVDAPRFVGAYNSVSCIPARPASVFS